MKTRTKWILGAVALLAVAVVAAIVVQKGRPKGTRVRTGEVTRRDLVSLVTANGTLQAETKVDVSANIMGQIVSLNVEEGDVVRKGDLLLVIDPARYAAVVESRRAGLSALEAEAERSRAVEAQAQLEWDRARRQFEDGILPVNPFQTLDDAVAGLMKVAVEKGRATRPDLELGICGEHGGDPASIFKCEALGLDYVSCSPFRVPVARLAAAQAVLTSAAERDK